MAKSRHTHVEILGTDVRIPTPDVPDGQAQAGDTESGAVAAAPAFQALLAQGRREAAEGRTVSLETFADRQGIRLQRAAIRSSRRPSGRRPSAASGKLNLRLPVHLHRELVEQAGSDGVSLNTLIVGLLERGMGALKGIGE